MTTTKNAISTEDKAARVEEAHNAIAAQVATLRSSDEWQQMLQFAAAFHTYSFGNVLWLRGQAAAREVTITRVAGYGVWRKLGRQVRKGERGFRVLAPITVADEDKRAAGHAGASKVVGWKTATVFDVAQTDGEPLPTVDHGTGASGEVPDGLLVTLSGVAAAQGYPWRYGDAGAADGHTDPLKHEMVVSDRFAGDDAGTVAVLLHEIGHVALGHLADGYDYTGHRGTAEVEAESVAYVVGQALGLQMGTSSFSYVAHWGDEHDVQATGAKVLKVAKALIGLVEG
jgi:antirestriction protein ArdC